MKEAVDQRPNGAVDLVGELDRHARVLGDVAQCTASAPSIHALVDRLVAGVCEGLRVDACALLEVQPGGDELLLRAGSGWPEGVVGKAFTPASDRFQAGFTLRAGGAVLVDDTLAEPRFERSRLMVAAGARSSVSVRVGVASEAAPYGVLSAHTRALRRFTPRDARFLEVLAAVLATAVDRFQGQRRSALERAVLGLVSHATALEEVLDPLGGLLAELVGTEVAELWVREGDVFTCRRLLTPRGPPAEAALRTFADRRFALGEGLVGGVAREGRARWVTTLRSSSGFVRTAAADALGLSAGMAFPIVAGDVVTGVITSFSSNRPVWDAALPATLDAVGRQLGELVQKVDARRAEAEARARLAAEQRSAQAEVARAYEWLARITAASPDLMLVHDFDTGETLFANHPAGAGPLARLAHGFPESALADADLADRGSVLHFWRRLPEVTQEADVELHFRVRPEDDGERWVHLRAAALRDGTEGRRVLLVFRDVTSLREQERALGQREAWLDLALQAGGACVYTLEWGPASRFVEMRGVDELLGESVALPATLAWWLRRVHPEDVAGVEREHDRLRTLRGRDRSRIRYRIRRGGDRFVHVEDHMHMVRDAADRIVRSVGVVIDVEAQFRFEEQLRDQDRQKDEFLAMLGHELRNPLAAIHSASDMLEVIDLAHDGLDRVRATVSRQTEHMRRLIDALLDVSRALRGGLALETEPLDLAQLVQQALEDRHGELAESGLDVETRLEGPVPVRGDRTRLTQVVDNLVSNSLKFTPPPGVLRVSVEAGGAQALLVVEDTGEGIPEALRAHVFEPFRQGRQALDRPRGGLGLGLSLVREIVRLHGGTVEAHSAGVGRGTRMEVRLPLRPGQRPSAPPPAAAVGVAGVRRVLVVEDNMDAAEMLGAVLEALGHDVTLARDGEEALARAAATRPHLVLCDVGLPGALDGHGVARALRADPATAAARLVALTGYGQPEDRSRALDAGFDDHVTKPLELERLRALLAATPGG